MHAYLFTGGSDTERTTSISSALDTAGVAIFDRLTLAPAPDKQTIGIADVRAFIQRLFFSPQGTYGGAGIILNAGALTVEAQQALLKTIEEPPPHVALYVSATSETQILPTIVSRCQIIRIVSNNAAFTSDAIDSCTTVLQQIRTAGPGQRIHLIQSIGSTRDEAKLWMDCAIVASHRMLLDTSSDYAADIVTHMHGLLRAKALAENNVNPFQLLEHVFLSTTV